jgi:hypothetical protein
METKDKKPFQSKKFWAFLTSSLIIAAVIVIALFTQTFTLTMSFFMSIMGVGLCALSIGYIVSQTALDKYMQGIANIMKQNKD